MRSHADPLRLTGRIRCPLPLTCRWPGRATPAPAYTCACACTCAQVAWTADPVPLLQKLMAEGADVGASTDCLDVSADNDKTPRRSSPYMCGHAPNNTYGAVLNTGVLWFRSTADAIGLARKWAMATLGLRDPYSDDQGAFNRLITQACAYVHVCAHTCTCSTRMTKGPSTD